MPNEPINLIDARFPASNLFKHLPVFDRLHYLGHPEGKIQLYKAFREDQECTLLALTIIRKEEDFLWAAAEDLLSRCVQEAAARVQGKFIFDLLTFDIHAELNTFHSNEFGLLIANHSRKIQPGEQRLVKYSSAYGILLFKQNSFPRSPLVLLINDVSSDPIDHPEDQSQREFLAKILAEQSKGTIEFLPEVYVKNKHGVRELTSGSVIVSKR